MSFFLQGFEREIFEDDGDGDFCHQSEDEKSYGEDSHRDLELCHGGPVYVDLTQCVGRESGREKSDALFDINTEPDQDGTQIQGDDIFPGFRDQKEQKRDDAYDERCPAVEDDIPIFPDPDEKIFQMNQVFGIGIDLFEHFGPEEEKVDEHGVGHQFGNLPDGFLFDLESRGFFQNLK